MLISVIRTLILYAFIIVAIRLMGKRQISDMQPSELVVTLVVSDIASLPMQNTSQPLLSGVVPVLVLVSLEIATSVIMMKSRTIRKLVCGSVPPSDDTLLALQGQLRRLRMTTEDLFAQLRQQNIFSLADVQYCIVETNGMVSVLEKPQHRIPDAEEMGVAIEDNKLETVVISDGKLLRDGMELCQTDSEQVKRLLEESGVRAEEVFLMTLDGKGNYQIVRKEAS